MKCPSLIVLIYYSFCFTFCLTDDSLTSSMDFEIMNVTENEKYFSTEDLELPKGTSDGTLMEVKPGEIVKNTSKVINYLDSGTISETVKKGARWFIENTNLSSNFKETLNGAANLVTHLVSKLLPVEGEKLFLQRNCVSHRFSRRSLDQYYKRLVDHPYQCESLTNETDKFRRIIGCETGTTNFVCYGISETDPLPEPEMYGTPCYEIVNAQYTAPDCNCLTNLIIHGAIHALSAVIISMFFICFICHYCACRRRTREQPEDIDFDYDFVKHNRSNF